MVSRYFILSGIPICQLSLCNEIQNMVTFLVKNIPDWNSFEFITTKIGRRGPSKEECQYYNKKLVSEFMFLKEVDL